MTLANPALLALQLTDLTSLNTSDTRASITQLCELAATPYGTPAALCVYPEWIVWARLELDRLGLSAVKIATVTNFPRGQTDIDRAVAETTRAVSAGADEVDVVFPYQALLTGDADTGTKLVAACKQACIGQSKLKVIIESGELAQPNLIRQASLIAIEQGADFIKTSTGKVAVNATLESAEIMLQAIKESGRTVGFKAAGGVRSVADASAYLLLAERMMGADWLSPANFRFGASSLLQRVVAHLSGSDAAPAQGY